jgi:hypothetical protein
MTGTKKNPLNYQAEVYLKNEYFDKRNPHPGETLLKTLDFCFQAHIDVPDWAKIAYRQCYKNYGKRISSEPLRTAFDTDTDTGKYRSSKRLKQQYLNTVCHTLWHLHINENWPIDGELFAEVAKRHGNKKGLGASTIRGWFHDDMKPMLELLGGGFVVGHGFVKK